MTLLTAFSIAKHCWLFKLCMHTHTCILIRLCAHVRTHTHYHIILSILAYSFSFYKHTSICTSPLICTFLYMHILLYAPPTPFLSLFLSFLACIHMHRYALFLLYALLLISTYCYILPTSFTSFCIFPHALPMPLHTFLISSPISFSHPLLYPSHIFPYSSCLSISFTHSK